MSATTTAKWTTKEIKDELLSLITPEAHFTSIKRIRNELVKHNLRRLTFTVLADSVDKLSWAARRIRHYYGIYQVIVDKMENLDYYNFRIYINEECFQKRGTKKWI